MPTPSLQLDTTFAAVSSSGVRATLGSRAAWVGRTIVNGTAATIAATYTTSGGAPASITAAVDRHPHGLAQVSGRQHPPGRMPVGEPREHRRRDHARDQLHRRHERRHRRPTVPVGVHEHRDPLAVLGRVEPDVRQLDTAQRGVAKRPAEHAPPVAWGRHLNDRSASVPTAGACIAARCRSPSPSDLSMLRNGPNVQVGAPRPAGGPVPRHRGACVRSNWAGAVGHELVARGRRGGWGGGARRSRGGTAVVIPATGDAAGPPGFDRRRDRPAAAGTGRQHVGLLDRSSSFPSYGSGSRRDGGRLRP